MTIADQGSGKFVFASNVKTKNRNTESKKMASKNYCHTKAPKPNKMTNKFCLAFVEAEYQTGESEQKDWARDDSVYLRNAILYRVADLHHLPLTFCYFEF